VRGLLNVQFAIGQGVLYVLEANPRASRTVPFVSKALGIPLAKAASRIMAGETIRQLVDAGFLPERDGSRAAIDAPIAVKEAVLPFKRFRTDEGLVVDSLLGPEMRSTGEVMGMDRDFPRAFAKSQSAAGSELPQSGTVFISVADRDKRGVVLPAQRLSELGYRLVATQGTQVVLARNGIESETVLKHSQHDEGETIVDLINRGEIDMIVNTPSGSSARADGYEIRAAAVAADKPIFTTVSELSAAVGALSAQVGTFDVKSLQEYQLDRDAELAAGARA
jgi:carbamoyl-phosphate synthase large subunit